MFIGNFNYSNVVLTFYVTHFNDFLKLVICCILSTCLLNEYEWKNEWMPQSRQYWPRQWGHKKWPQTVTMTITGLSWFVAMIYCGHHCCRHHLTIVWPTLFVAVTVEPRYQTCTLSQQLTTDFTSSLRSSASLTKLSLLLSLPIFTLY